MTRNEAIELLQFYKKGLFDAASNQLSGDIQAFDMAIQALEQEPCEDTISRQAVFDIVDSYSVSQSNVEDVTQDIISDIMVLPSVKPQEKTGHWIADVDKWGDVVTTVNGYRCDKCNAFNSDKDNYCPNCGCHMIEPQERSE